MSNPNSQRVPCTKCAAMVLPITAQLNNGLCAKCRREEIWAEQAAAPQAPPPPPPKIDVRVDESHYDKQQWHLIREIIRVIRSDLAQAGIPKSKLAEVTGDIAFSIATILDGCSVVVADGHALIPMLTFAEDGERIKLVTRPGGSFMHEYVYNIVDSD